MNRGTGRRLPTRLGELPVRQTGEGPPAVLWHSLFVDSRSWRRVDDRLAQHRTLVIIDGPGHGQSASPRGRFSLDACAEAGVDVLDALGLESPVDWIGNAWGGHVGIVFAGAHPARCRTLVTIGTPVEGAPGMARAKIAAMVALYHLVGPARPQRHAAPLPDVRHLPPLEAPDAVADLVTDFWRSRPPSQQELHPASTR